MAFPYWNQGKKMPAPYMTPSRIVERLQDKSQECFKDSSALHEVLVSLKSVSGHDANMLKLMSECSNQDGMAFQEAARLITESLKDKK
jgi:hypothetical protein